MASNPSGIRSWKARIVTLHLLKWKSVVMHLLWGTKGHYWEQQKVEEKKAWYLQGFEPTTSRLPGVLSTTAARNEKAKSRKNRKVRKSSFWAFSNFNPFSIQFVCEKKNLRRDLFFSIFTTCKENIIFLSCGTPTRRIFSWSNGR